MSAARIIQAEPRGVGGTGGPPRGRTSGNLDRVAARISAARPSGSNPRRPESPRPSFSTTCVRPGPARGPAGASGAPGNGPAARREVAEADRAGVERPGPGLAGGVEHERQPLQRGAPPACLSIWSSSFPRSPGGTPGSSTFENSEFGSFDDQGPGILQARVDPGFACSTETSPRSLAWAIQPGRPSLRYSGRDQPPEQQRAPTTSASSRSRPRSGRTAEGPAAGASLRHPSGTPRRANPRRRRWRARPWPESPGDPRGSGRGIACQTP